MKLELAIEIVLELARENIRTYGDSRNLDLGKDGTEGYRERACGTLEDFAVNILAEERANFPEED